jgi:hypothetical protein
MGVTRWRVMSREIRPIKDPGNVLEILEAGCESGTGQFAQTRSIQPPSVGTSNPRAADPVCAADVGD